MARSTPSLAFVIALGLVVLPGCGGGDEDSGAAHPTSHAPPPAPPAQAGSFSPGPPPGGGGGGGFVGGGGGGGGGGGHPRVGGIAGQMYRQARARQERIQREHRGPVRLTGLSDTEQRAADLAAAGRGAVPQYSSDQDTCERAWAQGAATETAYRAIRADGIRPRTGPEEERRFLAMCRSQTPEAQQCWDHSYRAAHAERCAELHQQQADEAHARVDRMVHAGDPVRH